jgi:hypothetical protein
LVVKILPIQSLPMPDLRREDKPNGHPIQDDFTRIDRED